MNFNGSQRAVINCKNNALIYASAGTGKTSTLAEKIKLQILDDGIDPASILCLTFTNRGCEEIKKKVSENVDEKFFQKLTIKTFHSFCFELLNEYRNLNGFPINDAIIYDEDDCKLVCKEIRERKELRLFFSDDNDGLNKLISYMKDHLNKSGPFSGDYLSSLKEVIAREYAFHSSDLDETFKTQIAKEFGKPITTLTKMIGSDTLCDVVDSFQRELEISHALDFNDLVYYANRYILDDEFCDAIAKKYKWIYIDESQDTSFLEYSLIKKISKYSRMVLSGDFFQTIYEWRGSNPSEILSDFRKTYDPEIFYYDVNYRSTKNIALASFSVLRRLFPTEVDDIYRNGIESANADYGDYIGIHKSSWISDEAEFIDQDVRAHNTNDSCILVRTNPYAKELSYFLQKINPDRYFLVQDYQYYRRPEVKEILAFLRLIMNPYDTVSLERIAIKYVRGFGDVKLLNLTSDESYKTGVRIADLLDKKTHEYGGDSYGCLLENLNLGNVVVFDTETTGLNIDSDEVIQIACRRIDRDGNELDRFVTLVKTNKGVGDSVKVHHITDDEINRRGINKIDALTKFLEFTRGAVLVGQNVTFDISIMNSELERAGLPLIKNPFYDTLVISRRFIEGVKNYKLETLTKHLNLPSVGYHDAMEDVIATSNLMIYLINNPIAETKVKRIEILKKYLNLFNPLMNTLNGYKDRLYESCFEKFVEDVVASLNMEKIYSGKREHLFNIHHFVKLTKLLASKNTSNFNCLRNVVNIASLSTNDFDAIYKEHGLIPIITVHQSKGCEFDTVYMAGVEDGMYPAFYAKGKSEDEEKRVFYVGITRAKKRLVICFREYKDNGYGKIYNVYPSPFLGLFDRNYLKKI